jgi:hypothetical protein
MSQSKIFPRSEAYQPLADLHPVELLALEVAIQFYREEWPQLAYHLRAARVRERHFSGAGSFTELVVDPSEPPLTDPATGEPLNLVLHRNNAELAGGTLGIGATTLAFVTSGYLSCLEIAAYDSFWDADLSFVSVVTP